MKILILFFLLSLSIISKSQEHNDYKIIKQNSATPVKNQYKSGTCWSFAAISYLESELIRMGKGQHDLSEMYIVKQAFIDKAKKYIRMHGKNHFTGGGEFSDVMAVIRNHGILPEQAFSGLNIGENLHIHGEMNEVLKSYVDAVLKNYKDNSENSMNEKLTPVWDEGFELVLNAYLGNTPQLFSYQDKEYNAETFFKSLEINLDDYIYITSFNHHPFYTKFILEVPDNWSWEMYYNLPLEEFMQVINNAILNGFTVAIAGDVSENGFSWEQGEAKLSQLQEEKDITQNLRQYEFDNFKTTDDHGMHLTGIAEDENGDKFYIIKNSWGTENSKKGYIYVSEKYIKMKMTSIMVHKDAIPKDLLKKLSIK